MFTMLNRMCWNSRGWRIPTNTSTDGGYPSKMGFGHEEWNFQVEDAVNGYIYGYIYLKKPADNKIKQAKGHFRIGFWSLDPKTRQKLLVGIYEDAELSTIEDMNRVDREFLSRGIYERRARELYEAVDTLSYKDCFKEVENSVKNHWLNYKCPVEEVKHLDNYIPVEIFLKNKNLGTYFSRPTYIPSEELPKYPIWEETDISNQLPRQSSGRLIEDAYYRESKEKLKRIIPRHNRLSNSFSIWARNQGYQNVVQEENYVDISFSKNECTYLAELKVCYGVGSTKSIREALGQLLEYNYYGLRNPADYWLIVLDERASESDIKFIDTITSEFGLPIFLGWMEDRQFTFSRRLP